MIQGILLFLTAFIYFINIPHTNTVTEKNITEKWQKADSILNKIKKPVFPDNTYNIIDFGAVGDGLTLNTTPINNAIKKANNEGGGTVIIPKGVFLSGAIHLLSNVNLRIEQNAILKFSTNPEDYLPVVISRWEGIDCYNYSPLIYAYNQKNIAVTGNGKLDGQADNLHWWPWKGRSEYGWQPGMPSQLDSIGRPLLKKFDDNKVPVDKRKMGRNHYLRPPFIQFYKCENILLQDVTIENSPFWVIHPLLSENVTIRGVHVNSSGPNNDGCDPESCKNVLIENCFFNTGDDCIALKSGRNFDGRKWNIPVENVIVRNCNMQNGHGGIVVGSEISGGCKNIFVEDCVMSSPDLDRAIRIKTNSHRGGVIEDFFVRNIKVGEVNEAVIKINCKYEPVDGKGNFPPVVKNIYISGITSQKSRYSFYLLGLEDLNCINDIYISDSDFSGVSKAYYIKDAENVHINDVKINGAYLKIE